MICYEYSYGDSDNSAYPSLSHETETQRFFVWITNKNTYSCWYEISSKLCCKMHHWFALEIFQTRWAGPEWDSVGLLLKLIVFSPTNKNSLYICLTVFISCLNFWHSLGHRKSNKTYKRKFWESSSRSGFLQSQIIVFQQKI